MLKPEFDIVVVGGGHAGVEAAWAAARLGAQTALVTLAKDQIAQMSCNPAVGGIGKGQIVREVDALGGLMGLAADATGMQFRMLNLSRGPAVWGPRCQSDRHAYAAWVRRRLADLDNLTLIEGEATDLLAAGRRVVGVRALVSTAEARGLKSPTSEGNSDEGKTVIDLPCRAAVITAGTFLRGLLHCGPRTWPGGRYGEPAAERLSGSLARLGLRLERLKTGTCPRVSAESIDYAQCRRQDGDERPVPFSFLNDSLDVEQVPCWITATNRRVHDVIRENLDRAPLFDGQITSTGPRYCPSVELKVQRFPDKDSHQIFVEPEGRRTNWVYLNGLATSLPIDVQEKVVRALPGLARAEVLRWGYAVEYDFADPTQLRPSLEAKALRGVFLAGQVNGTTGYEEAAAQGLIAGANAVAGLRGRDPLILRRDQAYIGVLIDDLVTKGVLEPYRMFTSRAEYRLMLRADNADRRLTPVGREVGLVDEARWGRFSAKRLAAEAAERLLGSLRLRGKTLAEHLARPGTTVEDLLRSAGADPGARQLAELHRQHPGAVRTVAIDCRYAGYLARQIAAAAKLAEMEARGIPRSLDYRRVPHLRAEARQRLAAVCPETLGQALRVSGITPADVTVLMVHLSSGARPARQGPARPAG